MDDATAVATSARTELGEFIRDRRIACGIATIKKLADMAKVSRPLMSMIEAGKRPLRDKVALRLAPILAVDPAEFLMRASRARLSDDVATGVRPVADGASLDGTNAYVSRLLLYGFDRLEVEFTVLASGRVRMVRRVTGCRVRPGVESVNEVLFRDRCGDSDAVPRSSIEILSAPRGLRAKIASEVERGYYLHRVSFPAGWKHGALDLLVTSERESPVKDGSLEGGIAHHVTHPTLALCLSVAFEEGAALPNAWLEPCGWWGGGQPPAAVDPGALELCARRSVFSATERGASLTVEAPLINATMAIGWRMAEDHGRRAS